MRWHWLSEGGAISQGAGLNCSLCEVEHRTKWTGWTKFVLLSIYYLPSATADVETYKETWRVIEEAHSPKLRNSYKMHQKGVSYKTCYFQIVSQRIAAKWKKKFLSQKHS